MRKRLRLLLENITSDRKIEEGGRIQSGIRYGIQ